MFFGNKNDKNLDLNMLNYNYGWQMILHSDMAVIILQKNQLVADCSIKLL